MKFYRREALEASLRSISGYIREAGAMRLGGDYSLHIHFFQGFSFTASCGPFPEVSIYKALPTLSPVYVYTCLYCMLGSAWENMQGLPFRVWGCRREQIRGKLGRCRLPERAACPGFVQWFRFHRLLLWVLHSHFLACDLTNEVFKSNLPSASLHLIFSSIVGCLWWRV